MVLVKNLLNYSQTIVKEVKYTNLTVKYFHRLVTTKFNCLRKYNATKQVNISVTGATIHIPEFPKIIGSKKIFRDSKINPRKEDIIADCLAYPIAVK